VSKKFGGASKIVMTNEEYFPSGGVNITIAEIIIYFYYGRCLKLFVAKNNLLNS